MIFHVFSMMFPCFSMIFPWFSHDVSMIFHVFVHDFPWFSYDCPWFLGDSHLECLSCRSPGARADDPLHAQQAPLRGQGGCTGATAELAFQFVKDAGGSGDPGFSDSGDTFFWLDIRNDSGDTNMTGYKKYYYEFDVFEYLVGIICRFVSKWVALPLAS